MDFLVVDWDYFFPTPTAGGPLIEHAELYAWRTAEDPLFVEAAWLSRARRFLAAGAPLPDCREFGGFWERFRIADGAKVFYADSNAWAGQLFPSDIGGQGPWSSVHLFDAHHDCGYRQNNESFEQWRAAGALSAENWMLAHYWNGSRLFVHFPPWRESLSRPTEAPLIPVHMAIDRSCDTPAVTFDAVFVARSGAWVPSWCDAQFSAFLAACPARPVEVPQNRWTHPRPDVIRMAALMVSRDRAR
ncbi:hypothetical protein ACFPM3_22965 [Streptomyces coeruleoprunus]|uniref:Arginase n=1 Tax=Streptomyces coeruleoprunus TaxID=285563 RepID=A0ABV9XHZ3_9ACTN